MTDAQTALLLAHIYLARLKKAAAQDKLAQPEQEPVAYAGIKMWVGDHQVVQCITQTELHYSREPWLHLLMKAEKCVAALKEKNT